MVMARPTAARQRAWTLKAVGLCRADRNRGLQACLVIEMSVSKDNVVAALGKIASPDGVPLPAAGKLSDIVATDGKVFSSIPVDAGAVRDWEAVRERAQDAVRALPGVQSVMVALTAERAGGGTAARGAPSRPQGAPPRPGGPAGRAPSCLPGGAAIHSLASGQAGP